MFDWTIEVHEVTTMFSNILVGIDGRQGGRDAVSLAAQLAAPDATVTLAHVYGPNLLAGKGGALALAAERRESAQLLADERERCEIDADVLSCGDMSAARGLRSLAQRTRADLLAVGSSRHGPLGHVLMGDDARASLAGAPCAVAVAPRGYKAVRHAMLRIGVGYNGTQESETALAAARELAARHGGSVTAMWVVSLPDVERSKPIPADWPEAARRLTEDRRARIEERAGVQGQSVYGGPREELTRFSEGLDLLVVGSRGYGVAARLFRGSVSRYLVRHASCPLLALPCGASTELGPVGREAEREPVTIGS